MNPLKTIKCWIYPAASRYFSRATLVGGAGQSRRLFVDNSLFTKCLMAEAYKGPVHIAREWKIWIPALKRIIQQPNKIDLCIAVLPQKYETEFRGLYTFRGQEYVRQVINTSGTWDEIRKRFHKNKKQVSNSLAKKYSYRVSTDMKDFEFYYRRMHLPHTRKQFGYLANITSYEDMRKMFLSGSILLILDGGRPVAGALCSVKDRVLLFHRTGVLDGDATHVRNGAQMALYYFLLIFAKDRNFEKVDALKSRPFLNGGVYKTKREWGAEVCPDDESQSRVYFFIPRYTQAVVRFFQDNPVIIHTKGGLKGVVGVTDGAGLSEETGKALAKHFSAPGLKGLLLLSPSSTAPLEFSFS